jgi:hypothetical protein
MTSGGHARSGPAADPTSARSDSRGIKATPLPAEGYAGPVPDFPLSKRVVYRWEYEDKRRFQVVDLDATERVAEREAEVWAWLWTTPQACAWALRSERWRLMAIAHYARVLVICELSDATAADKGSMRSLGDDIGMSPAGLRQNGWTVVQDAIAQKRAEQAEPERKSSSRDRMKVVSGGGA